MTVIEIDNRWFVVQDTVIGPFHTHADAWRWIDHHDGDPVSRSDTIPPHLWTETWSAPGIEGG